MEDWGKDADFSLCSWHEIEIFQNHEGEEGMWRETFTHLWRQNWLKGRAKFQALAHIPGTH
jgi:hypothetical protein